MHINELAVQQPLNQMNEFCQSLQEILWQLKLITMPVAIKCILNNLPPVMEVLNNAIITANKWMTPLHCYTSTSALICFLRFQVIPAPSFSGPSHAGLPLPLPLKNFSRPSFCSKWQLQKASS